MIRHPLFGTSPRRIATSAVRSGGGLLLMSWPPRGFSGLGFPPSYHQSVIGADTGDSLCVPARCVKSNSAPFFGPCVNAAERPGNSKRIFDASGYVSPLMPDDSASMTLG